MKFCVALIFFVELHLDDVLEVLMRVGFEFLFTKLVDKYHRKIHRKYDDCCINGGDIQLFKLLGKKEEKKKKNYKNLRFGNFKRE